MKSLRSWLLGVLCLVAAPSLQAQQHFEYLGPVGPPHWGELSPDWKACGSGTAQTPVDFARSALVGTTT